MTDTKKSNTPYDDVHRTLLNDCPKLIIPVVNEMFQKKHKDNEKVTLLNNEFFINRQGGEQSERITDTHCMIGTERYHIECESSMDGTIVVRLFEYDSQIALQSSFQQKDKLVVKFPNTAILYLRHNENTPDQMRIELHVPGASCSYMVPVMKVQNYTIEEIFQKRLFFLIPFHIFTYEKNLKGYDADEDKLSELTRVYDEIIERLNEYVALQVIDEYTKVTIIDMSKKVLEHLAKKYSNVIEGVGAIMGGKILDYEAKDILNQGRAEGQEAGLTAIIRKKLERGDSVEKIADDLVENVADIQKIVDTL
ncbi:MAG: hypothetical protein IJZ53_01520 [Tyzzerella sp.]|nr:hypothetical protein [Tyzzerella sp.]